MRFQSYEELKRMIYLSIFPLSILGLIPYIAISWWNQEYNLFVLFAMLLLVWDVGGWVLIYQRRAFQFVEIGTLILLTASHISVVYDAIFHYLAVGKDGAFTISLVWVPLVIVSFFLILRAKWGLIYSLAVFSILLLFGLVNISNISIADQMPLLQFYLAYLVYIFIFYFALYVMRLFSELATMKKNAYEDALTGIGNRLQINDWLEVEKQADEPFSVIFFDIDSFKRVNDVYGHKVGDEVLKEMTTVVCNCLTYHEKFGRWGGEEFLILVKRTPEQAVFLAENIRVAVEEHQFKRVGPQSISIGVSEYQQGESVDSLLVRVDSALYYSKQTGKNKITKK